VLEISKVRYGGDEINFNRAGTNLEWFRLSSDTLTFVGREAPAKTSNPFTTAEPVFELPEHRDRPAQRSQTVWR
jgi:hypothetical protein